MPPYSMIYCSDCPVQAPGERLPQHPTGVLLQRIRLGHDLQADWGGGGRLGGRREPIVVVLMVPLFTNYN